LRHEFPKDYTPSSFCRSCGRDFSNDALFDKHRTGTHAYDFSLELSDGRRCKSDEELIEDGMRIMTTVEMSQTKRHNHRVGFDIDMWFDPIKAESDRKRFNALKL
jgi:hypothetical protein